MRRILFCIIILITMTIPVQAETIEVPEPPPEAEKYMPEEPQNFGEGLLYVLSKALASLSPSIKEATVICSGIIAISLMHAILGNFTDQVKSAVDLGATVVLGLLLLSPANALIQLGILVVRELSEYGKLFMPAMATALAAQGGVGSSAALYAATVAFIAILTTAVSKLIVPLIYIYICVSIAGAAVKEELLTKIKSFIKWLVTWSLKILLYVYLAYISITGVISGTADVTAVKAVKLSISAAVPVVGGILSDASETILVGAATVKNAAGVYGVFAMLSIWIEPFLKIAVQFVLLKLTGAVCGVLGSDRITGLTKDFSTAMGLVLAMTGTQCLLLIVSTVCFMRGVA